eukprot:gene5651-6233_t
MNDMELNDQLPNEASYSSKCEPVEQDTIDAEDITNVVQFIMPSEEVLSSCTSFGFHYNDAIFKGWTKQPSACCAAASVAGAWNSLWRLSRKHEAAFNHTHILRIYEDILEERLRKRMDAFGRKLGAPLTESFWNTVENELALNGKVIGGKKGEGVTKKSLEKAIKQVVSRESERLSKEQMNCHHSIDDYSSWDAFTCFADLTQREIKTEDTKTEDTKTEEDTKMERKAEESDEGEENDDDDDDPIIVVTTTTASNKSKGSEKLWDWKKDIFEIVKDKGGLLKLRSAKPSTASIGNWGLLLAVDRLNSDYCTNDTLTIRLFMGKKKSSKSKVDVGLSVKDSDDVIRKQWDELRSAFCKPNQVLLFHLKNHYALIFAIREWITFDADDQVVVVRQLLTARRGQRPTAWVDFSEARETMLNWEGYKILAIERKTALTNNSSTKFK